MLIGISGKCGSFFSFPISVSMWTEMQYISRHICGRHWSLVHSFEMSSASEWAVITVIQAWSKNILKCDAWENFRFSKWNSAVVWETQRNYRTGPRSTEVKLLESPRCLNPSIFILQFDKFCNFASFSTYLKACVLQQRCLRLFSLRLSFWPCSG